MMRLGWVLTFEGTSTQRNYDEDADIAEDNHEDCHHPKDDNYDNVYLLLV